MLTDWVESEIDGSELIRRIRVHPSGNYAYFGAGPDEQLSFLRHRFTGAMQRGGVRLWSTDAKASRIVLIADQRLPNFKRELFSR